MVFTKSELLTALQHELNICIHLAGKVDRAQLDYRPTPKQRSTIELLRYLVVQGPVLLTSAKAGAFDGAAWGAAQQVADGKDVDGLMGMFEQQKAEFAAILADMSDADFRAEIEMFGRKSTRGAFLVQSLLGNYIAYRTQLFLYCKSCGRVELNTSNLWRGVDAAPKA